jgi:hypothetical protein
MMHNRMLWAVLSIVFGVLQAWDSGAAAAGANAQLLIGVGVLLPAIALVVSDRWDAWVAAVIAAAILLAWARFASPVSLNALHVGLMVPAMYVFFVCRLEQQITKRM